MGSNLFIFSISKALMGENVRQARENEFPFIVSIGHTHSTNKRLFKHFCTGSLVSNRDILTAEHCLKERDMNRVRVIIGSRDLRQAVKYVPDWWMGYDQWAAHSNIRRRYMLNDIAVLRLQANVTDTIQPAALCNVGNENLVNMTVMLAGWGKKEDNLNPMIMDAAEVKLISITECTDRINVLQGRPISFELTIFCTAADPHVLVHQGDSGGPVLYLNTIVGITKGSCPFPDNYLHPGKLNIHFDISYYKSFILDVITI